MGCGPDWLCGASTNTKHWVLRTAMYFSFSGALLSLAAMGLETTVALGVFSQSASDGQSAGSLAGLWGGVLELMVFVSFTSFAGHALSKAFKYPGLQLFSDSRPIWMFVTGNAVAGIAGGAALFVSAKATSDLGVTKGTQHSMALAVTVALGFATATSALLELLLCFLVQLLKAAGTMEKAEMLSRSQQDSSTDLLRRMSSAQDLKVLSRAQSVPSFDLSRLQEGAGTSMLDEYAEQPPPPLQRQTSSASNDSERAFARRLSMPACDLARYSSSLSMNLKSSGMYVVSASELALRRRSSTQNEVVLSKTRRTSEVDCVQMAISQSNYSTVQPLSSRRDSVTSGHIRRSSVSSTLGLHGPSFQAGSDLPPAVLHRSSTMTNAQYAVPQRRRPPPPTTTHPALRSLKRASTSGDILEESRLQAMRQGLNPSDVYDIVFDAVDIANHTARPNVPRPLPPTIPSYANKRRFSLPSSHHHRMFKMTSGGRKSSKAGSQSAGGVDDPYLDPVDCCPDFVLARRTMSRQSMQSVRSLSSISVSMQSRPIPALPSDEPSGRKRTNSTISTISIPSINDNVGSSSSCSTSNSDYAELHCALPRVSVEGKKKTNLSCMAE